METKVSLDDITIDVAREAGVSISSDNPDAPLWHDSDQVQLQPDHLPIARVPRAWDRKAASPLSRCKIRVGKVWKRPVATSAAGAKIRWNTRPSATSPLQPVKKMRVEDELGTRAEVSRWEARDSPGRKIVTRSGSRIEGESHLLALPDEEDEEHDNRTRVVTEILDESGELLEAEDGNAATEGEWSDVGDDDEDSNFRSMLDAASAADAGGIGRSTDEGARDISSSTQTAPVTTLVTDEKLLEGTADNGPAVETTEDISPQAQSNEIEDASIGVKSHASDVASALPEGFVSPVKQRRRLGSRFGRPGSARRRQTMPPNFAANTLAVLETDKLPEDSVRANQPDRTVKCSSTQLSPCEVVTEATIQVEETMQSPLIDDSANDTANSMDLVAEHDVVSNALTSEEGTVEFVNDFSPEASNRDSTQHSASPVPRTVPDRLPSSPVPSIEGPHPRLPLRRSPRRKSTSPLKPKAPLDFIGRSHLVAFTPLKSSKLFEAPELDALTADETGPQEDDTHDRSPTVESIHQASPASSERAATSVTKPGKPRISDDTALLQAFLNRAAEHKNNRRLSTAQRESLTNRRDSDTVRQALASPAPQDVLTDLDPNSPSPRKSTSASSQTEAAEESTMTSLPTTEDTSLDDAAADNVDPPGKTRSGRMRKKPQVFAHSSHSSSMPSKITIRGSVKAMEVSKKTEAQEMALLTRSNTKKNKGASVLPKLRLTKLAAEENRVGERAVEGAQEGSEVADDSAAEPGRAVKWAQTLVTYCQPNAESESSQWSDEPEERMPWERSADFDPTEEHGRDLATTPGAPAPADTPSKPKIRRLKASKNAVTPAKNSGAPLLSVEHPVVAVETPNESITTTKPRRSRIATPAKGLGGTQPLLEDLEVKGAIKVKSAATAAKKRIISKLPAPRTITSASTLAIGQENLISSPPKKRTKHAMLETAGLPPTRPVDIGPPKLISNPEVAPVAGLASPAKKGRGGAVLFARVATGGVEEVQRRAEVIPGLVSPAKRRTRRTAG